MTGGVPDSGGGLGRASSSDGDGEGGSWQEDPPTMDKSCDSPSGGREGGRHDSQQHGTSQGLRLQSSKPWAHGHKRTGADSGRPKSLNSQLSH